MTQNIADTANFKTDEVPDLIKLNSTGRESKQKLETTLDISAKMKIKVMWKQATRWQLRLGG